MKDEKKNNARSFEEEIKSWQEVYTINPNTLIDLNRESHIQYEGNTVLLNDDANKEHKTRQEKRFKSNKSDTEMTQLQITSENNQDKPIIEENKGMGVRFREIMGIVKVQHEGETIIIDTITPETYKAAYEKEFPRNNKHCSMNEEVIECDMKEVKDTSPDIIQDKIKNLRITNNNTENTPKLK